MTRFLLGLIASFALAPPAAAQPAESFAQRLARLDDMQRRAVLRGALVNSGVRCGRVETAVSRGPFRNLVMWSARCAPGADYALFIGPDGSAQVRSCTDVVKLALPPCRLPPRPPQPAPRKR